MKKYAKILDEKTKRCAVLLNNTGNVEQHFIDSGFTLQEVEEAYDYNWYIKGYAPSKPQSLINEERVCALLQQLKNTDYVAAKIAEGAATKEEYAEIIENRQKWRDEINLLQSSVG